MNKKKAVVCTILFVIIIMGIYIVALSIKPFNNELSLFHIFSPCIFGLWLSGIIKKFYKWLSN